MSVNHASFAGKLQDFADVRSESPFKPETTIRINVTAHGSDIRYEAIPIIAIRQRLLLQICNAICKPQNRIAADEIRYDVEFDWNMPDRGMQEDRVKRHEDGLIREPWKIFMTYRKRFLSLIEIPDSDVEQGLDQHLQMLPVVRWNRNIETNQREWDLGKIGRDKRKRLLREYLPGHSPRTDEDACNPLGGLLSVAAHSPEITQGDTWPSRLPHTQNGETFNMGPAQIPVMTLLRRSDLMWSNLIQNIETAADQKF